MSYHYAKRSFRPVARLGRVQRNTFWSRGRIALVAVVILLAAGTGVRTLQKPAKTAAGITGTHTTQHNKLAMASPLDDKNVPATAQAATPKGQPGHCTDNKLAKQIFVSISARHLWACELDKQVYDSSVVTGMENLAADLTPTGTYHILSKQTDLYLDGSDSTGSWHDHVYYWMPFLNNQYGTYGFHDAIWRADGDFGAIDPYSSNASHGCVELPLATAKWAFNWAPVGTTLTIQS